MDRNQQRRSRVKTAIRSFREALATGDKQVAETRLAEAARQIRKAASKGVVHNAAASRKVSRLVRALNKAVS